MKNLSELGLPRLQDLGFKVPDFKSDEEEVAWLDRNAQKLGALALKHGVKVYFVPREPLQHVSLRLQASDVARARKLAKLTGQKYQTIMRVAVSKGLGGLEDDAAVSEKAGRKLPKKKKATHAAA